MVGPHGPAPTSLYAPSSTAIDLGLRTNGCCGGCWISHTCAILDNGDAKCWGQNSNGQLGDGGTNHTGYGRTDTNAPNSTAIDLAQAERLLRCRLDAQHTCAILDNGEVKCWGAPRGAIGRWVKYRLYRASIHCHQSRFGSNGRCVVWRL